MGSALSKLLRKLAREFSMLEERLLLLISLLCALQLAITLCWCKYLARLARLSDLSELQVFPTPTPSPWSGPREESSREPEEEEPPEDTRNNLIVMMIMTVLF